jgi:hypothetical protein
LRSVTQLIALQEPEYEAKGSPVSGKGSQRKGQCSKCSSHLRNVQVTQHMCCCLPGQNEELFVRYHLTPVFEPLDWCCNHQCHEEY